MLKKMIALFILAATSLSSCGRIAPNLSSKEADYLLLHALQDGNYEAVKEAVSRGASLNRVEGQNPLYYYSLEHMGENSYRNHTGTEIAQYLLLHGADPNYVIDLHGTTLLMYACGAKSVVGAGAKSLFQLLLECGADVTLTDQSGNTALDYGIYSLCLSEMDELLERGAKLSQKTIDTLFSKEQKTDYMDIIPNIQRILLDYSLYVNSADTAQISQELELAISAAKGDSARVVSLLSDGDMETSAISIALIIGYCNQDAVKALLEQSLLIPYKDYFRLALTTDNLEVAVYLQEQGNISNETALHQGVLLGQETICDYYMKRGFPSAYEERETLLLQACENGKLEIAKTLLTQEDLANSGTAYKALRAAILYDDLSLVDFICALPWTDVNFQDGGVESILQTAIGHGNSEIVEHLLTQPISLREDENYLSTAVKTGNMSILSQLLQYPDLRNILPLEKQVSALVEAIKSGQYDILNTLLETGVNPNEKIFYTMRTQEGMVEQYTYPLHEAARRWSSGIVTLLLNYGADSTLPNSSGELPAELAATTYNQQAIQKFSYSN